MRSDARARRSARVREGQQSPDAALPWRDYGENVLTPSAEVLERPFDDDYLFVSCRNVLNEWGYQIRLGGTWWRRADDEAVDDRWPVLAMLSGGIRFLLRSDAERFEGDLLTGVPVVIDGHPAGTDFLIASSSDVTHVFDVHPRGLRGRSSQAWLRLSNAWQEARDAGLTESEHAASLRAIAEAHGVGPGGDRLHSLVAETRDGRLLAVALTGSLPEIARHLVERWSVAHAILLDNGGSVGWFFCPKGRDSATLLVGGPNRRESGTAFMSLRTRGFLQPRTHECLAD